MNIEINCDMGEGYGLYSLGDDQALMQHIDAANIACGFHASDPQIMSKTVSLAKKHNVKVGAHPSYPDKQGFGRRYMAMSTEELLADIIYQVGALKAFLDIQKMPLNHIKPHGALYGSAAVDKDIANVLCDVALEFKVPLLGMAGTVQETVARERGVDFIAEFFADLEYSNQGGLIITRSHDTKNAKLINLKVLQALHHSTVTAAGGKELPIKVQSICIHSDTPNAIEIVQAVRSAVDNHQLTKR